MAKKSSTIYLESMFWDMISEYQESHGVSSRNDALQLILQEWSILKQFEFNGNRTNTISEPIENESTESKPVEDKTIENKPKKIDPRLTNGLLKIENSMKIEE